MRLIPWYAVTYNLLAWMPVFFLYFAEHVSLAGVLLLEAIYYAAIMALEVPSGYFSDRVGRRATLAISAVALIAAHTLFLLGDGFGWFAAAQLLLATGLAFNSGTDTALHYDSLATLGREAEFDRREAVVARNALAATALGGLLGGLAGALELRLAYAVSLAAAFGSLLIVAFGFSEPGTHERSAAPRGFGRQLATCLALLRQPALGWLFAFYVLMTVINHIPYEFYQPYLKLLGLGWGLGERSAPLLAGSHMAAATVIGALAASWSIALRDRLGTGPALLCAAAVQGLIIAAMGAVLHGMVAAVVLLRGVPKGLMTAPLNAAVAPRVARDQRATYLSLQSLAGRLAFAIALLGLAAFGGGIEGVGWPPIAQMLRAGALIAAGGMLTLAVSMRSALRDVDG